MRADGRQRSLERAAVLRNPGVASVAERLLEPALGPQPSPRACSASAICACARGVGTMAYAC